MLKVLFSTTHANIRSKKLLADFLQKDPIFLILPIIVFNLFTRDWQSNKYHVKPTISESLLAFSGRKLYESGYSLSSVGLEALGVTLLVCSVLVRTKNDRYGQTKGLSVPKFLTFAPESKN